jgi:curli biogenesis system outer membrane secretion channel CsgG
MKLTKIIVFALMPIIFASCASVSLQPVSVTRNASLDNYTYFYITPTETKTGSTGGVNGNGYGVYGFSLSKSTNPSDIISGYLIKKGMVRLPEVKDNLADKTLIINYGETGRRSTGLGGYAIEITLQILSAKTSEVICVATGEGQGSTEADDIRIAINRCLEELYKE